MPLFFGRRIHGPAEESHVRPLEFERPLVVRMNGRRNQRVIHKPR